MAAASGRQRDPFVIYCSLSPPLHPDTHTIYEDNRRARCALLEHSPDGCTRSRAREERRSGRRRERRRIEVGEPRESLGKPRQATTRPSRSCVWWEENKHNSFCVATQRFQRTMGGPDLRAGATRAKSSAGSYVSPNATEAPNVSGMSAAPLSVALAFYFLGRSFSR